MTAFAASLFLLAASVVSEPTGRSVRERLLDEIDGRDVACDARWRACTTERTLVAQGEDVRRKTRAALGGFPETKCPLNARVTRQVARDGYRVEMVMYESWPGVHVTANLFLPDDPKFAPPYPALLLACGHAQVGQGSPAYQRGAVLAAKTGFACLVFDPPDQGERSQGVPHRNCSCAHDHVSSVRALLGGTMLRYLLWDCIRSLDYLETRPEVDASRLGAWGNSGGGQMSVWLPLVDDRVKAVVASGALTAQRLLNRENATPVDGWTEFSVDGQFGIGLNQTSLLLARPSVPVLVESCVEDNMFPIRGAREAVGIAREVLARFGLGDRRRMLEVAGPHKWRESARVAGVDWMRRWLCGDLSALKSDFSAYRSLDGTFDPAKTDMGLSGGAEFVTPNGTVRDLPGERTLYDVMRDDFRAARAVRRGEVSAAEVAQLAGIRPDDVVRGTLAATVEAPRLTVRDREDAGERRDVPELARQLGRSVPGLQAAEILVLAEEAKRKFGGTPVVCAVGRLCVAAAHARKVRPDLVSAVELRDPPPSWTEIVEKGLECDRYCSVPGALRLYDWPELLRIR